MFLLGYDIGSSSIKAALVRIDTGAVAGAVQYPDTELPIEAPKPGWAEQYPDTWWDCLCRATRRLLETTGVSPDAVEGIGLSYQMHGLVAVDREGRVVRPAIIWCDSRAVDIGREAYERLGEEYCLGHLLNSPGNFTASKLHWVRQEEPDTFKRIYRVLLPGDYLAFRMTGDAYTTISGLSEGIFYDFKQNTPAERLLAHLGIDPAMLPPRTPTFSWQGGLTDAAARELGLTPGTPIGYRAGDQPNNALSLNVLRPGEVAATGGTSGVVYAVTDRLAYDAEQRVNSFAHVNYTPDTPRIGVLLCINGAGSQYAWLRRNTAEAGMRYADMERLAAGVPPGAEGLTILPFGNGAERMLGNRNVGSHILGLDLNRHGRAHLYRAGLEGIAFAFVYGIQALRDMNISVERIRVGVGNLFESTVFAETIATLTQCEIELFDTSGASGAAKAAGFGLGLYDDLDAALQPLKPLKVYRPAADREATEAAYARFLAALGMTAFHA